MHSYVKLVTDSQAVLIWYKILYECYLQKKIVKQSSFLDHLISEYVLSLHPFQFPRYQFAVEMLMYVRIIKFFLNFELLFNPYCTIIML